jgi:predicted Rossmann-fold nucleotide-binding protein
MVIFPGGFGTMDELMEVLTLAQTQKISKKLPTVIYGQDYWQEVLNFDAMIKWGTISKDDVKLFHLSDDINDVFDFLVKEMEKNGNKRAQE